jgi:hypothetical protein
MTEPTVNEDARFALMKKIDGKLAWICFFLILITLNTCSLADDIKDAVQGRGDAAAPAEPVAATPAAAPAPAPAPAQ